MSKFKLICREEGSEFKKSSEQFDSLDDAARYIKERFNIDYYDDNESFHTDYCTYELVGFTFRDIGRIIWSQEDRPWRDGFAFHIDRPPRHRIAVVRDLYGEVHHYRLTPAEIRDEECEKVVRDWTLLAHYSDEEYAACFGAKFADDLDGVLTPEEQDEYRDRCYDDRWSDGHHDSRLAALNARIWESRAPVPAAPPAAPDPIPF